MRSILLLFLIVTFGLQFTFAETEDELRSKVNSVSIQIKNLEKEINSYGAKVSKTQGEAKTLKEALKRLEDQKKLLETKVSYTKLQVLKTSDEIKTTQSEVAETEKTIKNQKDSLKELLISLNQKQTKHSGLLQTMLSQGNLSDSVHFAFQTDTLSGEIEQKTKKLDETRQTLEGVKAIFIKKNDDLTNLQKTLVGQKATITQTAEEKNNLLEETKNKEAEYQKLLKEKQEKKNALEKEVNDFEARLKVIVDTNKLPKYGSGALSYPVEKVIITQYFGNTPFATANSQIYSGRGHNGIDFGTPVGSKILATQDGTILGIGNTDEACPGASYGKWVLIKHTNGLSSLYAHLSSFLVTPGQAIKRGEVVALSGNTGYSTGPHLHFTVYASDAVHITGPTEYKSRACGTYLIMPVAPNGGYLNPLSYFK